jgi:hypothetical protein
VSVQLEALSGFADVIGKDNTAKLEFLKALGIAKIPFVAPYAPPLSALQAVFNSPSSVLGSTPSIDAALPPLVTPDFGKPSSDDMEVGVEPQGNIQHPANEVSR